MSALYFMPDMSNAHSVPPSSRTSNTLSMSPEDFAPPAVAKWDAWKIALPRHDMRLEIIAQDQGQQSGEWLAVGMPRYLK